MNRVKSTMLPKAFRSSIKRSLKFASDFFGHKHSDDSVVSFAVATIAAGEIANNLGVNIEDRLGNIQTILVRASKRAPTSANLVLLEEFIPNWRCLDLHTEPQLLYSADCLERMVSATLVLRETKAAIRNARLRNPKVSEEIARWRWDDQDWWAGIRRKLGSDGGKQFLTGMIRHLLRKSRYSNEWAVSHVDMLEEYCFTGKEPHDLQKTLKRPLRWGHQLQDLQEATSILLHFKEIDAFYLGEAFSKIVRHAKWDPQTARTEAASWYYSLIPKSGKRILFNKSWHSHDVEKHCKKMEESQCFDQFTKLGKALERLGCKSEVILQHCLDRDQRHMRGDWLLELIKKNKTSL